MEMKIIHCRFGTRGPFVSGPGEACTETYLIASIAKHENEAK